VYVSVRVDASTTGSLITALPLVARIDPAQPSSVPPPLAVQLLAFAAVQVSVVELPEVMVAGDAVRDTVSAGQATTTVA
jgi:hypothetical protein